MPKIYLSPSTQEFNIYAGGGTEEEYMNLLADFMEPYLLSSGINFVRNAPEMTAASSIRQSNEGNYDLHLALHSNAAPEYLSGQLRGSDVYYYPRSVKGYEAAEIIASNLRQIYPDPELVNAVPTTGIGEVKRTKAPAVLVEVAYHDNISDEEWIKNNLGEIASNLVLSLTQYFGLPFIPFTSARPAVVKTNGGNLNIREYPSSDSDINSVVPNGSEVAVLGQSGPWYSVYHNGTAGFAFSEYISLSL